MTNYDNHGVPEDVRQLPEWLQLEADTETARRARALHKQLLIAAFGLVLITGLVAAALVSVASMEWLAAADAALVDEQQPVAP